MTPYESLTFFLWLGAMLVPVVLLGISGRSHILRKPWMILCTLGVLYLVMPGTAARVQVLSFFLWEWTLVRGYLAYRQAENGKNAKGVFYLACVLTTLPLALVKFNWILTWAFSLNTGIGFLGISYLTFRAIGTIIEMRDNLIKELRFWDFLAFVLFFPTLASGPIDRYRRFKTDMQKPLEGKEYRTFLNEGVDHLMRGFLYKFVLAYLIYRFALFPLEQSSGWPATLGYMYAYSFYLFFDFAGYSAFAVGTSYLLGVKTPENFNQPFLSKSIKDFWNRWHMSLSFWFRDYIYMRFVLLAVKKKWFKSKYTPAYIGYVLLFGVMGLWHGIQWNYIVYGLYHAALMIGFDLVERQNKKRRIWGQGKAWDALAVVVTGHFVCLGLLVFSGRLF